MYMTCLEQLAIGVEIDGHVHTSRLNLRATSMQGRNLMIILMVLSRRPIASCEGCKKRCVSKKLINIYRSLRNVFHTGTH